MNINRITSNLIHACRYQRPSPGPVASELREPSLDSSQGRQQVPAGAWRQLALRFGQNESRTEAVPEENIVLPDDDPVNVWEDSVDTLPSELIDALASVLQRQTVVLTAGHLLLEMFEQTGTARQLERILKERLKVPPKAFKQALSENVEAFNAALARQLRRDDDTPAEKPQARFDASLVEVFRVLNVIKNRPSEQPVTDKSGRLPLEAFVMAVATEGTNEAARLMRTLSVMKDPEGEQPDKEKSPLEYFSTDLTFQAACGELPPVIGREDDIRKVIQILGMKNTTPNPILIGNHGVGKTAIVEGLAQYLVKGQNIPPYLLQTDENGRFIRGEDGRFLSKRILSVDWSRIEAESKNPNDFKQWVDRLVTEAKQRRGEVLLYVDEIHRINEPFSPNRSADQLKPALSRGEISLIGATTLEEHRQYLEKDAALNSRFFPVMVGEPDKPKALTMLRGSREWYEQTHTTHDPVNDRPIRLMIRDDTLEALADKAQRYFPDDNLPRSAFKLLDYTCSKKITELTIGSFQQLRRQGNITSLNIDLEEGLRRRLAQLDEDMAKTREKQDAEAKAFLTAFMDAWHAGKPVMPPIPPGNDEKTEGVRELQPLSKAFPRLSTIIESEPEQFEQVLQRLLAENNPFEAGKDDPQTIAAAQALVAFSNTFLQSGQKVPLEQLRQSAKVISGLEKQRDKIQLELDDKQMALAGMQGQNLPQPDLAPTITVDDVMSAVEELTGIPVARKEAARREKLRNMESTIRQRFIAQNDAVSAVCNAIIRNESGIRDLNKPIGSFLFLGPTGTGKTELAKTLAEFLFDDENAMVRFDMSEFMDRHSAYRLIGAPPGYVGYSEGGELTDAMKNPYKVVLFDEIEKAHPDVWNIFLQILDEGRVTNGQGKVVSFKDAVVIMTSNVGSAKMLLPFKRNGIRLNPDSSAFKDKCAEIKRIGTAALQQDRRFKPEFINRFDDCVAFHPLMEPHLKDIAGVLARKLNKTLHDQRITVTLDDSALDFLVQQGADFEYGARPLARYLNNTVKTALGQLMLAEAVQPGETIAVSRGDITRWEEQIKAHQPVTRPGHARGEVL